MKLTIDTSKIRIATVSLGKFKKTGSSLVPLIEEAIRVNKISTKDITEIEVVTGPGSFTGLRVGAAVANILSFILRVPVNGKRSLVIPTYS